MQVSKNALPIIMVQIRVVRLQERLRYRSGN